jgi:beta-1,4-mannosyl-glycoprotein beta-1,4-N-acetylglucosaminyltransferase
MTVYDCCCFLNENDLYEIRLNQHWDFVDKFIVVEAGETHTGIKKPLNFDHERFKPYASKIIYVSFDNFEEEMKKFPELDCLVGKQVHEADSKLNHVDWARDHFQMNYFKKVLNDQNAQDDDIVIFSCLDEMIKKNSFYQSLEVFKDKEKLYTPYNFTNKHVYHEMGQLRPCLFFNLDVYVYKFNILGGSHVGGYQAANITEFSNFKKILPGTLRASCTETHSCIKDAGWHFTFFDDSNGDKVYQKMKSWAHSKDVFSDGRRRSDVKTSEEAVQFMLSEYKISIPRDVVPMTELTHPKYLIDNQEKFKNFILTL